jgi:hypothetical protein
VIVPSVTRISDSGDRYGGKAEVWVLRRDAHAKSIFLRDPKARSPRGPGRKNLPSKQNESVRSAPQTLVTILRTRLHF